MNHSKKSKWRRLCLVFLTALLLAGIPLMCSQTVTVSAAKRTTGIYTIKEQKYYYVNGKRQTGWHKIKNRWHYFPKSKNGAMVTGFQTIGGKRYAFTKNGGSFSKGWHQIGKQWYYVLDKGCLKTGWHFGKSQKKYYLLKSGKNMGAAAVGTFTMGDGEGRTFKNTFNERGLLVKSVEIKPDKPNDAAKPNRLQKPTKAKTLRNYLLHGMKAMGVPYKQTPGWPGTASTSIPSTMDCSGFVGWATYQMTKRPGGCSLKSYDIPATYAAWGYGKTRSHNTLAKNNFKGKFKAGDVVKVKHDGGTGHVWIVIGQCSDGSYVLVHSSPPCVQISGTPTPEGAVGQAYHLAKEYMERYHKSVLNKYNIQSGGPYGPYGTQGTDLYNYVTSAQVSSFRFSDSVLSDPDGYRNMDAKQILQDLYGES